MASTDVYMDCVNVFRDLSLKQRLTACAPLVTAAEKEFDLKITKGHIHTINRESLVNGNVTAAELKKVYSDQMVGHSSGRVYYDELMRLAKDGLCPLCAHRDVSTLDHYLPKANYPRLSVIPINLIPACKDCNTGKLNAYPTTPQEETIHPYFDDIENDLWLKAIVVPTNPVSINFFVVKAAGWDDLLFERVKGHFHSFKLKSLYCTQAGRELSGRKFQLTSTFDSGAGSEGINRLLTDEALSRGISNKNSWQTALYTGLAGDDWFCRGGFRQIGS